jgi:hypothetical protein
MHVINARNVNEAYVVGLGYLRAYGKEQNSRMGKVLVVDHPVCTTYERPYERVLFNSERDANPFFHFMESLWMLAGRDDVEWISRYNSTFKQFSDDGEIFHAAYGHRWRKRFGVDQLKKVCEMLNKDSDTRRALVSMWDPHADFDHEGKDFPCNLNISFRVLHGKLDITVFNRSNDIIWGAYGANAVHMSMMQEYIAGHLELKVGRYYQVSNNFHAYCDILDKVGTPHPHPIDPYDMGTIDTMPIIDEKQHWDGELVRWMKEPRAAHIYTNQIFPHVAMPMFYAWEYYKENNYPKALELVSRIKANDWRRACREWLTRRAEKHATKNDKKRRYSKKVAHDTPTT